MTEGALSLELPPHLPLTASRSRSESKSSVSLVDRLKASSPSKSDLTMIMSSPFAVDAGTLLSVVSAFDDAGDAMADVLARRSQAKRSLSKLASHGVDHHSECLVPSYCSVMGKHLRGLPRSSRAVLREAICAMAANRRDRNAALTYAKVAIESASAEFVVESGLPSDSDAEERKLHIARLLFAWLNKACGGSGSGSGNRSKVPAAFEPYSLEELTKFSPTNFPELTDSYLLSILSSLYETQKSAFDQVTSSMISAERESRDRPSDGDDNDNDENDKDERTWLDFEIEDLIRRIVAAGRDRASAAHM